jgi:hypothetical protein
MSSGVYEVKNLLATIALLCLSSTVLAHDIYSGLRGRDGNLCCGGQECQPVEALALPNGNYYLPSTDETIPADTATPSPDERFVPIIQSLTNGVHQFGKANPRLDASLLQCTLRSSRCTGGIRCPIDRNGGETA